MSESHPRILVATDAAADAELVRRLLHDAYPRTEATLEPDRLAADFERLRPQVLVFAFKSLQAAERCYLGLHRQSTLVHDIPHRALVLCHKDQLQQAYDLCVKDHFDDYVLFWPMVHDATRLPMSVRLALRALDDKGQTAPLAQLAVQARRIAELEGLLERQLALGQSHAEQLDQSVQQASSRIGAALDGLSRRVLANGLDEAVDVRDPARVQREFARLEAEAVRAPLAQVAQAISPMKQWVGGLKGELAAPLTAAHTLAEQVRKMRARLLIVDDDEFSHKLLARVLATAQYDIDSASSAAEALGRLRTRRPDLILMDVQMPGIDGIEATRRLKAIGDNASIPVIMLTGHGERQMIVDSLAAGAADFVVKPFDSEILLKKVARYLGG